MAAVDVFGSLDVVINNGGYANLSPSKHASIGIPAQIETNLFGTIIVTKAALGYFAKRKQASSFSFHRWAEGCPPGRGPYSAANGVSKVLRGPFARSGTAGIKVTIVEPGGFAQTSRAVPPKLSEGRPEYDSTVGATQDFSEL